MKHAVSEKHAHVIDHCADVQSDTSAAGKNARVVFTTELTGMLWNGGTSVLSMTDSKAMLSIGREDN